MWQVDLPRDVLAGECLAATSINYDETTMTLLQIGVGIGGVPAYLSHPLLG